MSVSPLCLGAVMFLIILEHTHTQTNAVRELEQAGFLHKSVCVLGKLSHTPWVLKPCCNSNRFSRKKDGTRSVHERSHIHVFLLYVCGHVKSGCQCLCVRMHVFFLVKTIGSHRLGVNTLYFSSHKTETCCL